MSNGKIPSGSITSKEARDGRVKHREKGNSLEQGHGVVKAGSAGTLLYKPGLLGMGLGESHGGSLRRGHLQVFGDFYVKLLLDSQNVIEEKEVWQRSQVEIVIYLHTLV